MCIRMASIQSEIGLFTLFDKPGDAKTGGSWARHQQMVEKKLSDKVKVIWELE